MSETDRVYDLLVIGGGINGSGIAADAAGRGLDVALCEMNDPGSATSSASSKLIHGGLRYLEQYEFRLVHESLKEREILLQAAPHIVSPMWFRLPHSPHLRPRWMIWLGLKLYDLLARRDTLPASHGIRFSPDGPLREDCRRGFEYADCRVDDARLVILNCMRAREQGARIRTRTECRELRVRDGIWQARLTDHRHGGQYELRARAVVNAAGPWVGNRISGLQSALDTARLRLVKGSHIVIPKLYDGEHAYLLQHTDERVVFVIPWENGYSMIGTTEENFSGDPARASISAQERDYLIEVVNSYFRTPIGREDIVHAFSGVRPLVDEGQGSANRVSRDYSLSLQREPAPILTIRGGKLTTYRRLAETAMHRLREVFPRIGDDWTADSALPGGDFDSRELLEERLQQRFPWLEQTLLRRWVRSYGTLCGTILEGCSRPSDLGRDMGQGLHERELEYLCEHEWALTAEDVLWRRSKLGMRFTPSQYHALEQWLREYHEGGCPRAAGEDQRA